MKVIDMTQSQLNRPLDKIAQQAIAHVSRIPNDAIALLGRISISAVFWLSGRTKVDGFALSESAVELFREDYKLPLIDPIMAATLAAIAEHLFPILLLLGLASRLSAAALLSMTAVIQIFVYPGAWPIHGVWATVLLFILARGPGLISLDATIARYRLR